MMDRVEHAKTQALLAREQAVRCGQESARKEWLKVADLWEAIAHEYSEMARAAAGIGSPDAA